MRYLCFLILIALISCDPSPLENGGASSAFVPIYASAQSINNVGLAPSRSTVNAGKIYAYRNYLFQVEQNEGIHIIDNTNPQQAHKVAFLKVPMCSEIAIKSSYLYTNNLNDLVVFDLSNTAAPQLVSRLSGAFPLINQDYPPFSNVYFECPDSSKGIVVGWEAKNISNPKCRR